MNELMMLYRKRNFNSDSLYDENVINTMTENYFEVTYFVPWMSTRRVAAMSM